MIGTQFHPELQSRPNRPHPLFRAFVAAAHGKSSVAPVCATESVLTA